MIVIAIVGALALAAIPITIGWRRNVNEAAMAKRLGVTTPKKGFDPDKFARQTGTGLAFNQILFGCLAWMAGGFLGGIFMGVIVAVMFAIAGGLFYMGTLTNRRQEFRLRMAKDILRGLGVVETLLGQSRTLTDALDGATEALGPDGKMVFRDLVVRLRTAPEADQASAVHDWTTAWDNPAVDIVGTSLLAYYNTNIQIVPLVAELRKTLNAVVEVLSRARSAAKGVEWQARFLALFPPFIMVLTAITTPDMGRLYATSPWLLLPVLIGSGLSFLLTMRMIRSGLSIEASMGLQAGRAGEIPLNRMGKIIG